MGVYLGASTRIGPHTYVYNVAGDLIQSDGANYYYRDPLGRMTYEANPSATLNLVYDGQHLLIEKDASGNTLRRYVFDDGDDSPLIWYEGPGETTGNRRWLMADERGSVVAVLDGSGNTLAINQYDDWGVPGVGNLGRFQYTGQQWLPELQAYDYKARIYHPLIGRFLQTDPIGYGGGVNLYRYAANSPVNLNDPSGNDPCQGYFDGDCDRNELWDSFALQATSPTTGPDIIVNHSRYPGVTVTTGGLLNAILGGNVGTFNVGATGNSAESSPQNNNDDKKHCPPPSNVSLTGTIYVAPVDPAFFSGEMKDVTTGQTVSVKGYGYGGGAVVGTYDVTGTVKGFGSLSNGLDIEFAQGPFGSGGARFTDNNNNNIGEGSVNGAIAPSYGAGAVSFDPPTEKQTDPWKCP